LLKNKEFHAPAQKSATGNCYPLSKSIPFASTKKPHKLEQLSLADNEVLNRQYFEGLFMGNL